MEIAIVILVIYGLSIVFASLPFLSMTEDELQNHMDEVEEICEDDDRSATKTTIMMVIFCPVVNTWFAWGTIKNLLGW